MNCSDFSEDFELHLDALDPSPNAVFTIETYTDIDKENGEEKPDPDPLQRIYRGLTNEQVVNLAPTLRELNEKGAGVFIAVNQFNNRRRKKDISRIRSVHADFDNANSNDLTSLYEKATPSIVVKSSPGKFHCYYLVNDDTLTTEQAESINRKFVSEFGADKAAIDITRLLRLTGFKHNKKRKSGQTPIVQICTTGVTYSSSQLIQIFGAHQQRNVSNHVCKMSSNETVTSRIDTVVLTDIAEEAKRLKPEALIRPLMTDRYNSESEADLAACGKIARICQERGIPKEELTTWVQQAFELTDGGQRSKWQEREDYRELTINKAVKSLNYGSHSINEDADPVFNDLANAERYSQTFHKRLLYVHEDSSWLKFTNQSWNKCIKGEEVECAKQIAKEMAKDAIKLLAQDPSSSTAPLKHAQKSHEHARLNAMVNLASSDERIATSITELNTDPYLLGVGNGVVNLRTGQLMPNDPLLKITMYCSARYRRGTACEKWLKFLNQLFPDDPETIKSIQLLLGYTLTGLNSEELLVILVGWGANGKSVFFNLVTNILGGYAKTAAGSILKARRSDDTGPRDDIACLAGARCVSINETQAGDSLDSQAVKMLAGREPISARHLYGKYFSFVPTFTPWLRTNHLPIVTDTDDGIWRRLAIVPFNQQFKGKQQDPHLEQRLMAERDGILGWMIEGAIEYLKNGLTLSQTIKKESQHYRTESDVFGEFLSQKTTKNSQSEIETGELWNKWTLWADRSGFKSGSKNTLTRRLKERGYSKRESNGKSYYVGLEVKTEHNSGVSGV